MITITQHSDLAPFVGSAAVLLEHSLRSNAVAYGNSQKMLARSIWSATTGSVCVVDSGTTGLIVSLLHAKSTARPNQRQVIIPRLSYAATLSAVISAGCEPVFADVTHKGTIDMQHASTINTTNVLAIMPVPLWGHALDYAAIKHWADTQHIKVVIDAAQAWGTTIPAGSYDYCVYSFSANKPWPTFNSLGAVLTQDNSNGITSQIHAFLHHGLNDGVISSAGVRGYAAEDACAQALVTHSASVGWTAERCKFSERVLALLGSSTVIAPSKIPDIDIKTNWHKLVLRINSDTALDIAMQEVECKRVYSYYLDGKGGPGPSFYQIPNRGTLTAAEQQHILTVLADVLG